MLAPPSNWWKPLGRLEKSWLIIAFSWSIFLTAMMPLWYFMGKQNVPATTYRVDPTTYAAKVEEFATAHQVGEENGVPIVEVQPGEDTYLLGRQWQWYPILQLKKMETYKVHVSSSDVQHGLSIQPVNMNFMVLPAYEYVLTLTPTQSGDFSLVCNEYCYLGHHLMIGKIIVTE